MKFKSLEEKCKYYRSLSDYKLLPNTYVLVMVDGRSFSQKIKKQFKLPFDDDFINMMNETAKYVCEKVQGCKFAYTQSDEITFVLTDFDDINTGSFFGYRLEKVVSIIASLVTSKFNQLMSLYLINEERKKSETIDIEEILSSMKLSEFDAKAWSVPNWNDMFAYILWRQNDCIKNSKQQAARAKLSHSECNNKTADEQADILKEKYGIDWNAYDDGKKFGRFIYKEEVTMNSEQYGSFERDKFVVHSAWVLREENGREMFEKLSKIPQKS